MRFATKRSRSGCTVRSFLPTMYQLGFDLHAVPSSFWLKRSASGTPLGRPNKFLFLLLLWQISREACDATWLQPEATICDFDVAEDVCARKFILLALRRLVGIRRERADVDQSGNALVGSRGCNDCS